MELPPKRKVKREPSRFDKVGPKEKTKILQLLASGLKVSEVAKKMNLQRETINYHKSPEDRERRLNIRRRWYFNKRRKIETNET